MVASINKAHIYSFLGTTRFYDQWPFIGAKPWGTILQDPLDLHKTIKKKASQEIIDEYNDEVSDKDVNDKVIGSNFKELLDYFLKHDASLFYEWLRQVEPLFDNDTLHFSTVEFDTNFSTPIAFPSNVVKILKVNVDNLKTKQQLEQFLNTIEPYALFALEITGEPSEDFLNAITNVDFIRLHSANDALQKRAIQINHRNHLAKKLSVKAHDTETLLKRLAEIPPFRYEISSDKLFYLKPHGNVTQQAYASHVEDLYRRLLGNKKREVTPFQDGWAKEFELYSVVNGCIVGMQDLFFKQFIEDIAKDSELYQNTYKELVINSVLNEFMLQQLIDHELPFKKVNLFVDAEIIKSDAFKEMLQVLSQRGIEQLTLTTKNNRIEWNSALFEGKNFLIRFNTAGEYTGFCPFEGYKSDPEIYESQPEKHSQEKQYAALEKNIELEQMYQVQKSNFERIKSNQPQVKIKQNPLRKDHKPSEVDFGPKITIKEYIWNKQKQFEKGKAPINLEVRHVEVEQQAVVQDIQVAQTVQMVQLEEQQLDNIANYAEEGELVDYSRFCGQPYYSIMNGVVNYDGRSDILISMSFNQFANLPMAIRFMTHEAALQVARNLQAYAIFNLSTLPENFYLKKTTKGELVLDYNPYIQNSIKTVFTPCSLTYPQDNEVFLTNVKLSDEKIKEWIKDDKLFAALRSIGKKRYNPEEWEHPRLTQLYIKYGEQGVQYFFEQIKSLTANHSDMPEFLINKYFRHFVHLDCLLDNNDFFDALSEINNFDKNQLACFNKFLEKTGNSRHDLKKSVIAFQFFWGEWLKLCEKKQVDPALINADWSTSDVGNPVVYMERLLTILSNARNLKEQLADLNGMTLDNYGAYYASKYQGFCHVSKEMGLKYDTGNYGVRNNKPFPTKPLYQVELRDLTAPRPPKEYEDDNLYKNFWRYLAGRLNGISINEFRQSVQSLDLKNENLDYTNILLTIVLASNHQRYIKYETQHALSRFEKLDNHSPSLHRQLNEYLLKSQENGLFFNAYEIGLICNMLVAINPTDIEGQKELFDALQTNPQAALRAFAVERSKMYRDQVSGLSVTSMFKFAKHLDNDKEIHNFYRDDLLLFSYILILNPGNQEITGITEFLHDAAATEKPNNLDYLFNIILRCEPFVDSVELLKIVEEVRKFEKLDYQRILALVKDYDYKPSRDNSAFANVQDNAVSYAIQDLYENLLPSIAKLILPGSAQMPNDSTTVNEYENYWDLCKLELKEKQRLLFPLKKAYLNKVFENPIFSTFDLQDLHKAAFFHSCTELRTINNFVESATSIATKLQLIWQEDKVWPVIEWQNYTQEEIDSLLSVMVAAIHRPHTRFFKDIVVLKDCQGADYIKALQVINLLQNANVPDSWLNTVVGWMNNQLINPADLYNLLINNPLHYDKNNPNQLLNLIMTSPTPALIASRGFIKEISPSGHHAVGEFLQFILKAGKLSELLELLSPKNEEHAVLLEILARTHSRSRTELNNNITTDYLQLALALKEKFNSREREDLLKQFTVVPPYPNYLLKAVEKYDVQEDSVHKFLEFLELNPFGERTAQVLAEQFNISEVERVINRSADLKNASSHSYQYRKQWMEAFLFVNQIGNGLAVFETGTTKKAAKDLTNTEILELITRLKRKEGSFAELTTFQRQLFALGLMREAMYRTTGQFAYSTQILSLIDCMMHPGDVISGIRTGQGKSLIDTMKATLLWLDNDRVDLVTDSVVNAERDLAIYRPYFDLLGIDCAKKVITPKCDKEDYCYNGINFSTGAQLALFRAKLISLDQLNEPDDKAAVVLNEADQLALDDRRIYRYSSNESLVDESDEWIYEEIYAFILTNAFTNKENSTETDVALLKEHLKHHAADHQGNPAIVNKYRSPKQWVTWLESAVKVHYILKENIDYVVSEDSVVKVIHGRPQTTKYIEILSKSDDGTDTPVTGRINPEVSYGDGMQQLLSAKYNRDHNKKEIVIESETKTMISSNNKNFINYYTKRIPRGIIWGSTGTPGSRDEIRELNTKFGFDFSDMESHQLSQLQVHPIEVLYDELLQFQRILTQLSHTNRPSLVFFKDIDTAKRFKEHLRTKSVKTQMFLGPGDEATVVKNAGQASMITIATNAMGRNSNVLSDDKLDVYHTFVDTERNEQQKTGRTDRQGAGGAVYHFLNRQNYLHQDINELIKSLRSKAHEQARLERAFQEDFFDLTDVLLKVVQNLKADDFDIISKSLFIKNTLAPWVQTLEAQYRFEKERSAYDKLSFNRVAVNSFLNLFSANVLKNLEKDQPPLLPTSVMILSKIAKIHEPAKTYGVYNKKVSISDCTPPEILAYNFIETFSDADVASIDEKTIRDNFDLLINSMLKGQGLAQAHQEYLRYLNQSKPNIQTVRRIHQEYVEQVIKSRTEQTKKSAFSKFWHNAADLSKLKDDKNFLLLFYGLSSISPQEDVIQPSVLKEAIVALLDEYVNDSWFVNADRKASVRSLKTALDTAQTLEQFITILSQHKLNQIKADINADKQRFRKLNYSGSRFQDALDKALDLTHALTGKQVDEQTVKNLYADLQGLVPALPADATIFTKNMPFDAFHTEMCLHQSVVPKSGTAAVIKQSLEKSMDRALQYNAVGVLGRLGLFGERRKEPGAGDEPSPNGQPVLL